MIVRSIFFLIMLSPFYLNANCNFKSSEHIESLNKPSLIKEIKVLIPDSRKWVKDSLTIITDHDYNIDPRLRNKHKAKIIVTYTFGECIFNSIVRQSGDWKDHISFDRSGNLLASLDVKLKDGNILNAVRFKLFLPQTRNYENEVLGSLILRKLNFIVPETFIVKGAINNSYSDFIFQESSEKELLEKNYRREGPILEGDEELLWSYKDFEPFDLEEISLSRMSNSNWFKKNFNSARLGMIAFSKMQKAYLEYTSKDFLHKSFSIYPNSYHDTLSANYSAALLVLKGTHALRPHNRKYYYNSFEEKFEPIYYDGNFLFQEELEITDSIEFLKLESLKYSEDKFLNFFLNLVEDPEKYQILKKDFLERTSTRSKMSEYFDMNLAKFYNDLLSFIKAKSDLVSHEKVHELDNIEDKFIQKLKKNNLDHLVIDRLFYNNNNIFFLSTINPSSKLISQAEIDIEALSKLVSQNKYLGKRAVYVPDYNLNSDFSTNHLVNRQPFLNGQIVKSINTRIQIDNLNKKIKINQNSPYDWILFKNISFTDWKIEFIGSLTNSIEKSYIPSFNEYGVTGCLNFYNSIFSGVSIMANNGACEDSLNIIFSKGSINNINIRDAFSDAVDLDFSNIRVDNATISFAGNDCFDVSGGKYKIINGNFLNCGDKGVSIGENSNMNIKNISINNSNIGISVKDSSVLNAISIEAYGVETCIEAFNKKQEFLGAKAIISKMLCSGNIIEDINSSIKIL